MDTKQKMKRAAGWLLVLGALLAVTVLLAWKGAEWGETRAEWGQVIIQGLAALGGLWYAAYRSRPRVTLQLRIDKTLVYLDLANVGNRVARRVKVKCEPRIHLRETLSPDQSNEWFGPCEDFGDMDRGQRHTMAIGGSMGGGLGGVLDTVTFTVSHESAWVFGPRESSLQFRGSGLRHVSLNKGQYADAGQIATEIQGAIDA